MGAFERCMRFKTGLTLGIQFYTFDKRTQKEYGPSTTQLARPKSGR